MKMTEINQTIRLQRKKNVYLGEEMIIKSGSSRLSAVMSLMHHIQVEVTSLEETSHGHVRFFLDPR